MHETDNICCFCGKELKDTIGGMGQSAYPIKKGYCCDKCYKDYDILDARLMLSIIQPTRPYNLDDICNIFNINKQTIRQYIKDNKIYAKKVGNQYTVLGTSILDFLKKRDD